MLELILSVAFALVVNQTPAAPVYGYTYTYTQQQPCWITNAEGFTSEVISGEDAWCAYDLTPGATYTVTTNDETGTAHSRTFVAADHDEEYNTLDR